MNERIISSGDAEICTEAFGNPDNPALLLVIGASASMLRWDEQLIARFTAAGYYAIRFDNRDTGQSSTYPHGEPPYTLSDMAADAIAVLDAYHIEKAHVMGRSMGGMITQHLALDYPERIITATLIYSTPSNSIAGGCEDELPGMTEALIKANQEIARTDGTAAEQTMRQVKQQEVLHGSQFPFDADKGTALVEREKTRAKDFLAGSINHGVAIRNSDNWRSRLSEITTPTLIIHGTEDPIFQMAHAEALAAEINDSEVLWITGMGHVLPEAVWDIFVPRVLKHIGRHL